MKTSLFSIPILLFSTTLLAQVNPQDTVRLETVLIQAYATEKPIIEVPAAIGYLDAKTLQRFNNTSILPAINTVPGVRMEERSPGSFRFSIRGSLLRSPFGVRNVKAYWNNLPLTDGGGNTYLNLIDFNAIGNIEIIKGPGGSLYGAGTGGVVLLKSPSVRSNNSEASFILGSYGLRRFYLTKQIHSEKVNARIHYGRLTYGGYREQTEMRRDALNADVTIQLNSRNALSATLFYTDLTYETPGGLTQAQYNENPKQARPAGGPNRGAVEQQAQVFNKTPYVGINYEHDWNEKWSTRVGVFGSHSDFSNPTIRNTEIRDETNIGTRAETHYIFGEKVRKTKITLGGEYQYFKSPIAVYGNTFGLRDTLQTRDKLTSRQMFLFTQAEIHLPANFYLTLGGSVNFLQYDFDRSYPNLVNEERSFEPAFAPRVALLSKITPELSMYGSVSQGFSPPSVAELYPSRQIFDKKIDAERGNNYEAGIKGAINRSLNFDLTVYSFQLKRTLVIRRDATLPGEPEYFVNAGSTSQRGVEALVSWDIVKEGKGMVSSFTLWNSYARNRYRFNEFIQDESDYSGNKLTGVPPTVNSSGLDISFRQRIMINLTGVYVDHTPLDDANTVFAREYFLLGGRLTYNTPVYDEHKLEIFAGIDNALDKKYSLGNDLNAVGGRYFNAAAPRNYYAGIRFTLAR